MTVTTLSPEGTLVHAFFVESSDMLQNLAARWQDEQQYEDIADYAKPLEAAASKHGVKIVKMHGRPFGVTLNVNGRLFRITVNSRTLSWKPAKV